MKTLTAILCLLVAPPAALAGGLLDTTGVEKDLRDAQKKVKGDVFVLCHGGPISEPEDARYILDHTQGIAGFFGASSIERLPTEVAITACVRRFKEIGH